MAEKKQLALVLNTSEQTQVKIDKANKTRQFFILQDINNYESTRSDKFCEFDREILHCYINTELFHNYIENIWLKIVQLIKSKYVLFSLET